MAMYEVPELYLGRVRKFLDKQRRKKK
jgi:hypothetical protein